MTWCASRPASSGRVITPSQPRSAKPRSSGAFGCHWPPICARPWGWGSRGGSDEVSYALKGGTPGTVELWRADEVRIGVIRLADTGRDDAARVLRQIDRDVAGGLVLLTGDHEAVARRIADEVGGGLEVHARLTPPEKAAYVAERQAEGHTVLFVGDGLNDGPALVRADVGLAMRGGAAASVLAADGVVVDDALAPVRWGVLAGRVVRRVVRGNMVRSVAYNVFAVGFAAAGLVDPLVAAVLMPLSSLLVIAGGVSVQGRIRRAGSEEEG